jgi:hypothetical protein
LFGGIPLQAAALGRVVFPVSEAALCICNVRFAKHSDEQMLVVGTALNLSVNPFSHNGAVVPSRFVPFWQDLYVSSGL